MHEIIGKEKTKRGIWEWDLRETFDGVQQPPFEENSHLWEKLNFLRRELKATIINSK